MHNPALMHERQCLRKRATNRPHLSLTDRSRSQPSGQRRPADELHNQERSFLVGVHSGIEDGHQTGVIKTRQQFGLVSLALRVGIKAGPRRKDLHRDRTAQEIVQRQVHLGHAALAQQSLQAIPTREHTALPQRAGHSPLLGLHVHPLPVTPTAGSKTLGHTNGPGHGRITSPTSCFGVCLAVLLADRRAACRRDLSRVEGDLTRARTSPASRDTFKPDPTHTWRTDGFSALGVPDRVGVHRR